MLRKYVSPAVAATAVVAVVLASAALHAVAAASAPAPAVANANLRARAERERQAALARNALRGHAVGAAPEVDPNAPFLVGAGIADATGPSTEVNFMGYAQPSQVGSGIHFRLRARAFVVVDPATSKRIAFVSLDSGMSGQLMKMRVVTALQEKYGADMYTHDNVCISGTHSHSGPAGFLQYVLFDITSLGFVEETLDAFVDGCVAAIERAHNALQPGQITWPGQMGIVPDANINRSPTAYENNPADRKAKYPYNTDKEMLLVRFAATNGTEIGMLNWYAVHGTSMNNTNTKVSGDNKGYASMLFEEWKNPEGTLPGHGTFVAAFAQTNLGDVSPNVNGTFCLDTGKPCDTSTSTCNGKNELCVSRGPGKDMVESTQIIGERQYEVARNLYESSTTSIGTGVDYIHAFLDISNYTVTFPNGTTATTCKPAMGYSFAAGTTDGPGAFNFHQGDNSTGNSFWNAVSGLLAKPTPEMKACHHPKPILLATGEIDLPYQWDPTIVAVQILRIGKLYIVAAPAEFTTMAGRMLREAVADALTAQGVANPIVTIAGLANGYASYVTNFEEYQVQRYEGASTVYGPHEHMAYVQSISGLATAMAKGEPVAPGPSPPDLSKKQLSFLPGVITDGTPWGTNFGDVLTALKASYSVGDAVSVTFQSACPRNNLMTESTYLTVELQGSDGSWTTVATDGSWETVFHWYRHSELSDQSFAEITWTIPDETPAGTYRIGHQGYYKHLLSTHTVPFSGHTDAFSVVA